MPVFQSRHPALNDYISGAVNAIGDELAQVNGSFVPNIVLNFKPPRTRHAQGTVAKVVMVIKDMNDVALERFIFAVQSMIEVELFNKDTR